MLKKFIQSSDSSVLTSGLLGLLGLGGVLDGIIGSNCDSLSAVGLLGSGNKCDQQTLCCTGNNFVRMGLFLLKNPTEPLTPRALLELQAASASSPLDALPSTSSERT